MNDFETARETALRYMDYAPRTRAEVRRRLLKGGFDEETIEAVLADLEHTNLLDDAQFSKDWVESRSRRKGLGRVRLAAELRRKGVSKEQTEEAVGEIDEEAELAAALEIARKRLRPEESADPAAKRRLAAFLQRRGYKWEIIEQVFSQLFANNE